MKKTNRILALSTAKGLLFLRNSMFASELVKVLILSLIFLLLFIAGEVFAQGNITNTLGTSGLFTIKDASNNYLTLSQITGQVNILRSLRLENTTSSTVGVIYKGADRFIHNYGTENTFVGKNSGNFTLSGGYNSAFGNYSLYLNTTGSSNSAFGNYSLYNTTGDENSAFGVSSLFSNTTGSSNSAFGTQSLFSNTTGYSNSAFGLYSLHSNSSGYNNTGLGYQSLYSNSYGIENTALGFQSLYTNTTGARNTAVGVSSLHSNTIGYNNTAVGWNSLYSSTGWQNTAVGLHSLFSNTTGYSNTALGEQSLYSNTTGFNNTALGRVSGSFITTGTNLTCIGYNAEPTSGSAVNQITLGNSSITSLRCQVTTITALSDARDKKNIQELPLGLDFISKLKPRQFNWDKREWYDDNISDGSKMKETPTAGFIAQELDEAQTKENAEWLNLVLKDNPQKLEATPGNLLPVMVKAIQELNEENQKLKIKNQNLEERLTKYEEVQNKLAKRLEDVESKQNQTKEDKLGEK
jgi:endosialidase-like protein